MKKKLLSLTLAICLTLGSAAALPEGMFTDDMSISASASWSKGDVCSCGDIDVEAIGAAKGFKVINFNLSTATKYTLKYKNEEQENSHYIWCTAVGEKAFEGWKHALYSVELEYGYETIEKDAFINCWNLLNYTVPSSVETIGEHAMGYEIDEKTGGYTKIDGVTIYGGKNSAAEKYAKDNGFDFKVYEDHYRFKDNGDGTLTVSECIYTDKEMTIPGTYNGKKVVAVADEVFYEDDSDSDFDYIEKLTISENIKKIGKEAFRGCNALKEVILPNSLEEIGDSAFRSCGKIEKIKLNKGLKVIGNSAFENTSLKELTIPNTVKTIGNEAFQYTDITELKSIPSSVEYIGYGAFDYTPWVNEKQNKREAIIIDGFYIKWNQRPSGLKIPSDVKFICGNAFMGAASDDIELTIPGTVKRIGERAFGYCMALKKVIIEEGVETVDNDAFCFCHEYDIDIYGCLDKIYLPRSLKNIGERAFGYGYLRGSGYFEDRLKMKYSDNVTIYCYKDSAGYKYAKNNGFKIHTHDFKLKAKNTAPTCEVDGGDVYACSCGLEQRKNVKPKLGHSYKVSTAFFYNNYTTAEIVLKCERDSSHEKWVYTENVKKGKYTAPTCTEYGGQEYTAIATYEGKQYTCEITVIFPPLGHKWDKLTYKWSSDKKTCTASHACLNEKGRTETETVQTNYVVTVKPTTKTTGIGTYTAVFTKSGFTTQKQTIELAKEKYDWSNPVYTWSADRSSCTAKRVAKNDKTMVQTEKAASTSAVTKQPTCTAKGVRTFTVSFKNTAFSTQKKFVDVNALGHKWGAVTYTWSKDNKTCTATRVCQNDKTHKQTETVKTTYKLVKANCTANGTGRYTAAFKNTAFGTKTKDVTLKAAGSHSFSAWTTTSFNVDKGTSTQTRKCSRCGKIDSKTVNNAVIRFAGANRYDTAAKLSKSSYNTADTVIIADGMTFQDALIAVPLASAYNAPLLLANPNTITTQTKAELERLKAKKVIIVNTNSALKKPTLDALKKYNPTIISGKNCFETSKKVAEALQAKIKTNTKSKTTAPTDVFFTTNKAFADALSVSPVAALKGAPILYVDPSKKTLDSNITAYLNKVKGSVKNVYIVGGLNAIPKALENSIKSALPKKNYKRFDGAQRYETCIMINEYFASILSSKTVCVAKGLNFPDALAGGFFAAKQKAPLILADNALKDAHKNYLKKKAIDKLYIFGGTVAVPDKLAKEIAKASV